MCNVSVSFVLQVDKAKTGLIMIAYSSLLVTRAHQRLFYRISRVAENYHYLIIQVVTTNSNKRLLVAYTRAAVINSVQQANLEIAEQINQGQPHTQS